MIAKALCVAWLGLLALVASGAVQAQAAGDSLLVDAREALRKKDSPRLLAVRNTLVAANHPLAQWADYWELGNRLLTAQQAELDAFYARWPGSYVEDRLRNDWLLELGRRRDWANFATEFPRFRMNDDREVSCYALLVDHLAGKPVREAALAAWLAQRDGDSGCALLGTVLFEARVFTAADLWRKARAAADANRPRAARQAVVPLGAAPSAALDDALDRPAKVLAGRNGGAARADAELASIALVRLAAGDTAAAAAQMESKWARTLPADLAAWTWAAIARRSATELSPDAADQFQNAHERAQQRAARERGAESVWPEDALAWKVRAALRADNGRSRWRQVIQAVDAMPEAERSDAAWSYWRARALLALAGDGTAGEAQRDTAHALMSRLASPLHFYGQLAAEHLGQSLDLPRRPARLMDEERDAVARQPGLQRALQLIAIGLRNEGVREWNFSLRGFSERELLAAAQLACDREVWDRCINTSDRTRGEIDVTQRYPVPFRADVEPAARSIGLDPAYVYGLIRQESRFILDARSGVGASGLMQLMPATARWTAKRIALDYRADMITDRDVNLRLGTTYLKLVLDDFAGSAPMAAAAYNAGPGRPRKWREGPVLEPAIWAENIPFNETRDYVKKVLSNATVYAALLGAEQPTLKARLGAPVGPRPEAAAAINRALP